jgi:DNA-3-methyladenine glycosylase
MYAHTPLKPLQRSFYLRPTLQVACDLLGKQIVRKLGRKILIGKIVEVEAYRGSIDPASHAYRGKTKRNEVMFGEGGHLYVYFTYGMHFCANIVTGREGIGEAVLIRAVEPLAGLEEMKENREIAAGRWNKKMLLELTSGPARFCRAFGIARPENGTDLLGTTIFITSGDRIPAVCIRRTTRVGIRNGTERRWRFYIEKNPWVSRRG